MLLIEVLTGALIGSLTSARQTPGWNPTEYGGMVMAIDIGSMTDIGLFKTEVAELCAAIRSQTPAQDPGGVAVPGDRGHARKQAALESGEIEVGDETYRALKSIIH